MVVVPKNKQIKNCVKNYFFKFEMVLFATSRRKYFYFVGQIGRKLKLGTKSIKKLCTKNLKNNKRHQYLKFDHHNGTK